MGEVWVCLAEVGFGPALLEAGLPCWKQACLLKAGLLFRIVEKGKKELNLGVL